MCAMGTKRDLNHAGWQCTVAVPSTSVADPVNFLRLRLYLVKIAGSSSDYF
jgi:hypothetical protein